MKACLAFVLLNIFIYLELVLFFVLVVCANFFLFII